MHEKRFKSQPPPSYSQTLGNLNGPKIVQRKSIVFMGRQHPGESVSSFVIEGIIEFIMDSS